MSTGSAGVPMVRVLHATPSYAPAYRLGGPVRSLEGLLPALRRLGVTVRVVTTDDHGPDRLDVPRGWQERAGIPVLYLKRWARPDVTPRFFSEVLREARRADVVHVTGFFCVSTVLAVSAARLLGRPVVLSPRGALEAGSLGQGPVARKRKWIRAFRGLFESVSLFHVTSEKEAVSVRRIFGDGARVAIVPNGTELPDLTDVPLAPRPVVAALGRIHPVKGYDRLLEACAILIERGGPSSDFEVQIAGPVADAEYARALQAQIERLGLTGRAKLVGEVLGVEKTTFLRQASVLALPSHDTENFGNVVIEALACETPVVASRHAPWAALESEGCGRWVENEPKSLAEALAGYLSDAKLRLDAGQRGRSFVSRQFSWMRVASDMHRAYEVARGGAARSVSTE